MKRMFGIVCVWSMLAFSLALANPARPLYEPPPTPKPPPPRASVNLTGTAWLGKYAAANRTYVFEPDGTISYSTTGKTLFKGRGSWRLMGDSIYFDHHIGVAAKKTLEFQGTIKDSNTIVGIQTMINTGVKTNVTMQRTAMPGK